MDPGPGFQADPGVWQDHTSWWGPHNLRGTECREGRSGKELSFSLSLAVLVENLVPLESVGATDRIQM